MQFFYMSYIFMVQDRFVVFAVVIFLFENLKEEVNAPGEIVRY